jgi:large subunit ribosomal protein L10e
MRKAFGKPIGLAARVYIGTTILELLVKTADLQKGKIALHAAKAKLPVLTDVKVTEITKVAPAVADVKVAKVAKVIPAA